MNPSRPRVLLAEDDDELRDEIQEVLELRGFQVIPVEDGLELADYLILCRRDPNVPEPSLLIAEIFMPGKTAVEVLEEIQPVAPCPIVLLCRGADHAVRKRAAEVGATMVLEAPIDPQMLGSVAEALVSQELRPRRLLIADDDDEMRETLGLVLGPERGEVKEASSGWDLLASLDADGPFDLVVTDVRMPGPSGLQVVASARTAGLKTPFLVITAFPDERIRAAARTFEDVRLLDKPFGQEDFLAAVEKLVHPAHPHRH